MAKGKKQGEHGGRALKDLYSKISLYKNVSENTVRQAVSRKILKPDDLRSILEYIKSRRGRKKSAI